MTFCPVIEGVYFDIDLSRDLRDLHIAEENWRQKEWMSGTSPEEGMYMVCSWVKIYSGSSSEEKENGIGNGPDKSPRTRLYSSCWSKWQGPKLLTRVRKKSSRLLMHSCHDPSLLDRWTCTETWRSEVEAGQPLDISKSRRAGGDRRW